MHEGGPLAWSGGRGEDNWPVVGDGDGVLDVGGAAAVGAADGPAVGVDPALVDALQARVGPSYQGADDETVLKSVGSIFAALVFLLPLFLGGYLLIRWASGGASPLTFQPR